MAFADDLTLQQRTVTEIQQQAQNYLDQLLAITNVTFSDGFNIDRMLPINYSWDQTPQIDFPVSPVSFKPDVQLITKGAAPPPTAPTFTFSDPGDIPVDPFTESAPVLNFPQAPDAQLPASPGVAPTFRAPDMPSAPAVSLPSLPSLDPINLPEPIPLDMPQFDGIAVIDDLVAPTRQFTFMEAGYQSALLDPLKVALLDNLVNGGYGIETSDEIALFNRARDREVETMMTRIDEASQAMAARGFPLPPGELAIHIDRAYQSMQDKVSSVSREIMLERAKLYVENRQFTVKEIRDLESTLMNFYNSVQERALNTARLTMEFSIATFKALVEKYNARLNNYRAHAEVFADKIRAEMLKTEGYRNQIQAASVASQIQRTQVETYLAQLKGIESVVAVYKTQTEAAKVQADIERLKLEAFHSEVQAYTAQVQAKVAEFNMFTSQVGGETAKVQAFEAQVKAYLGQVEATKAKAGIKYQQLQAEIETARAKLSVFNGELDQYKADVERQVAAGKLQVEYYNAAVGDARVQNEKSVAQASLQETARTNTTNSNLHVSQLNIEQARAKLEATVQALKFKTEGTHFASEKFYAVLSALMSTINTLSVSTQAI